MDRVTRLQAQPTRRVNYDQSAAALGTRGNLIPVNDLPATRATTQATRADARRPSTKVNTGGVLKPEPVSNKTVKVKAPPKKKEPKPKRECTVCATTKSVDSFRLDKNKEICEHFKNICGHCVSQLVRTKIERRQFTEPGVACIYSNCDDVLDHDTVKSAVHSKTVFSSYDDALTKHHLAASPNFITCLSTKCGRHFSIEDCSAHSTTETATKSTKAAQPATHSKRSTKSKKAPEPTTKSSEPSKSSKEPTAAKQKIECPYCNYTLCLTCNRPWHTSKSCSSASAAEDAASVKQIQSMGAKPCPKCGVNIEKHGGCDHMTCNRCRHNFCWVCLVPYDGRTEHQPDCPQGRRRIMEDVGNWIPENATVEQVNRMIEHAQRRMDENMLMGMQQGGQAHPPAPARGQGQGPAQPQLTAHDRRPAQGGVHGHRPAQGRGHGHGPIPRRPAGEAHAPPPLPPVQFFQGGVPMNLMFNFANQPQQPQSPAPPAGPPPHHQGQAPQHPNQPPPGFANAPPPFGFGAPAFINHFWGRTDGNGFGNGGV